MTGQRSVDTKLWLLDVPTTNNQPTDQQPVNQPVQHQVQQSVQQSVQQQHQPLQKANMPTNQSSATPAKLVEFSHAALFSTALSTLQKPWTSTTSITSRVLFQKHSRNSHPSTKP